MDVYNKTNTYNTGSLEILRSHLLIGKRNVTDTNISLQISQIPVKSEQPLHTHEPEQCYYIINGTGLMIIENEERVVSAGDAIHISSNKKHGIKNIGNEVLEYLTANPVFGDVYEKKFWPAEPEISDAADN